MCSIVELMLLESKRLWPLHGKITCGSYWEVCRGRYELKIWPTTTKTKGKTEQVIMRDDEHNVLHFPPTEAEHITSRPTIINKQLQKSTAACWILQWPLERKGAKNVWKKLWLLLLWGRRKRHVFLPKMNNFKSYGAFCTNPKTCTVWAMTQSSQ